MNYHFGFILACCLISLSQAISSCANTTAPNTTQAAGKYWLYEKGGYCGGVWKASAGKEVSFDSARKSAFKPLKGDSIQGEWNPAYIIVWNSETQKPTCKIPIQPKKAVTVTTL